MQLRSKKIVQSRLMKVEATGPYDKPVAIVADRITKPWWSRQVRLYCYGQLIGLLPTGWAITATFVDGPATEG